MPVYVDNEQIPYRHMKMCHMLAERAAGLLVLAQGFSSAQGAVFLHLLKRVAGDFAFRLKEAPVARRVG